jgi:hypothetical protein
MSLDLDLGFVGGGVVDVVVVVVEGGDFVVVVVVVVDGVVGVAAVVIGDGVGAAVDGPCHLAIGATPQEQELDRQLRTAIGFGCALVVVFVDRAIWVGRPDVVSTSEPLAT